MAGFALAMAWRVRTTVFQKTIIIGSYVYAFFAMFSVFSFIFKQSYFGLSGVEPYLIGSFIDIIIFSGALGYRFKKLSDEKNQLLQFSLELAESRAAIAKSLNDDVGAALSSMHVYAAVADKLLDKDTAKVKEYLQEINTNTMSLMNEVSDIIWALNLLPENIPGALNTRIKRYGIEILEPKNIECTYHVEEAALLSIQDIGTAKDILQQVREGMLWIAEKSISHSVLVRVVLHNNKPQVSVQ